MNAENVQNFIFVAVSMLFVCESSPKMDANSSWQRHVENEIYCYLFFHLLLLIKAHEMKNEFECAALKKETHSTL